MLAVRGVFGVGLYVEFDLELVVLVVLFVVLFAGFVSEKFEVADRVKFARVGELVIFSLTT